MHVGEDGLSKKKTTKSFSDTSQPTVATKRAADKSPTDADRRNVKAASATRAPSPPASRNTHPVLPATLPLNTHYDN